MVTAAVAGAARSLLQAVAADMLLVHGRLEAAASLLPLPPAASGAGATAPSASPALPPHLSAAAVVDACGALLVLLATTSTTTTSPAAAAGGTAGGGAATAAAAAAGGGLSGAPTQQLARPFAAALTVAPSAHPLLRVLAARVLALLGAAIVAQAPAS